MLNVKLLNACLVAVLSLGISIGAYAEYMQEKVDARVEDLMRTLNHGDFAVAEKGYNSLKDKYGYYASMKKLEKALYGNNFSMVANGQCVMDGDTGLMWERKTNDGGLRDKNHTYSWYSTTHNGGDAGWKDEYDYYEIYDELDSERAPEYRGQTCNSTLKACNTADYVKAVNQQGLCGYNDWRLPTRRELLSLVDKRKYGCAKGNGSMETGGCINTDVFHHVGIDKMYGVYESYWSSSPYVDGIGSAHAWNIAFFCGDDHHDAKNHNYAVRLVRSGQ